MQDVRRGRISKTAAGGEINVIDAGGFGAVNVTKSITIDGSGAMASILGAGTTAIIINIPATSNDARTVRIRGLAINGAGYGIDGNQGGLRFQSDNREFGVGWLYC